MSDTTLQVGGTIFYVVLYVALIAAVLYGLWRLRRRFAHRPCPRCGRAVRIGMLDCNECGFDFRRVGA